MKKYIILVISGEGGRLEEILSFPTREAYMEKVSNLDLMNKGYMMPNTVEIKYLERFGWHNLYNRNIWEIREQMFKDEFFESGGLLN